MRELIPYIILFLLYAGICTAFGPAFDKEMQFDDHVVQQYK